MLFPPCGRLIPAQHELRTSSQFLAHCWSPRQVPGMTLLGGVHFQAKHFFCPSQRHFPSAPTKELTFGSIPPHPSNAQPPFAAEKHLAGLAPKLSKNSMPSCEQAPCHHSRWRPALPAKRLPNGNRRICKGQDSQLEGSEGGSQDPSERGRR